VNLIHIYVWEGTDTRNARGASNEATGNADDHVGKNDHHPEFGGGGGDLTTLHAYDAAERKLIWGGLVRARLSHLGLSVEDLRTALAAGGSPVSKQTVYFWLRGTYAPTEDNRDAIARVLFSTTEALFPRSPR
jgi:hypothetical protein